MKKKAEKQPYLYLRLIEMLLGILITAIGLSCMMKSQLGQTAITAFTQNLTAITGIKSGTVLHRSTDRYPEKAVCKHTVPSNTSGTAAGKNCESDLL